VGRAMVRLSVAVMMIAAAGVCGSALASAAPPTFAELLTGVGSPPGSVPGLCRPVIGYGHQPGVPTARACSAIWNAHAPRRTLRWVASHSADRADVTVYKARYQVIGGTPSKRGVNYNCTFGIAVGPTQVLLAVAPPKGTTAAWQGELLTYASAATVTGLVKRFNATVKPNGTIHLP
jgi:hypothetical protein